MSEFSSEPRRVNAAVLDQRRVEMQALLQQIAGPAGLVKARIRAAAKALGWSYSRTKDLWYADGRARVDPPEILQARAVAAAPVSVPVEVDLERLRSLEDEVAALRTIMAATLQRMEGEAPDPAQHRRARPRQGPRRAAQGPGLFDRPVAGGG